MHFWAVLDCEPTRELRELKRAYARQLKLHLPEADPDGFQRLRHAYEALLAELSGAAPAAECRDPQSGELKTASIAVELASPARGPQEEAAALAGDVLRQLAEGGEEAGVRALQAAVQASRSLQLEVEDALEHCVLRAVTEFEWYEWPGDFVDGVCQVLGVRQRAVLSAPHAEFLDWVQQRYDDVLRPRNARASDAVARLGRYLHERGESAACALLEQLLRGLRPGDSLHSAFAHALLEALPALGHGRWPRALMARIAVVLELELGAERGAAAEYMVERTAASVLREQLELRAREAGEGADACVARLFALAGPELARHPPLPAGAVRSALRRLLREIGRDYPSFWSFEWPAERRFALERIARRWPAPSRAECARALRPLRADLKIVPPAAIFGLAIAEIWLPGGWLRSDWRGTAAIALLALAGCAGLLLLSWSARAALLFGRPVLRRLRGH